jgi:hypothetical protein
VTPPRNVVVTWRNSSEFLRTAGHDSLNKTEWESCVLVFFQLTTLIESNRLFVGVLLGGGYHFFIVIIVVILAIEVI